MTIQEITTRKEDQTLDCESIQIEQNALTVLVVAFANADGGRKPCKRHRKTQKR